MRQVENLITFLENNNDVYDLGFMVGDLNIEKMEDILEIGEPRFEGVMCYGQVYDNFENAEEDTGADDTEMDDVFKVSRMDSKGELHTAYELENFQIDILNRFKETIKEVFTIAPELKELNIEDIFDNKESILEVVNGFNFKLNLENELSTNQGNFSKKSKI